MIAKMIHPAGILDAAAAEKLLSELDREFPSTIDFTDVTEVHFAALRRLMNARRSGTRFSIVNASDEVLERFVDTGVAVFIDICRKPRPLDMSKYIEFGASFMSKSYNSQDGDAMIKIYGDNVPQSAVAREKAAARAAMLFGLPTPLVGTVYADDGKTALEFERIPGKRSFSRIISEEPERTEEIIKRFAQMCRQLHETQCDTAIFSDQVLAHRQAVLACTELSDGEKSRILQFADAIPAVTTCLHGDLQISNVIRTDEGEDLWIDLGDFGYGYPMMDLGMWYFLTKLNTEQRAQHLFHLGLKELAHIWDLFAEEYAGARTQEQKDAFEQEVRPFAGLHMIYLGVHFGFLPGMVDLIRQLLL